MKNLQNNDKTTPLVWNNNGLLGGGFGLCLYDLEYITCEFYATPVPHCVYPHVGDDLTVVTTTSARKYCISDTAHDRTVGFPSSQTVSPPHVTANLCCNGHRIKCECGSIAMATSVTSLSYFHLLKCIFFLSRSFIGMLRFIFIFRLALYTAN